MKPVLLILFFAPLYPFAQTLQTDIIKATGDTLYSSKLQPVGGFGSLEVSVFKTKNEMTIEFLKLVNNGKRFTVVKNAPAFITLVNGKTDTLYATETSDPKLLSEGHTIMENTGHAQSRSSIWTFTPVYFLTEKDIRVLGKQPISSIAIVTNEGTKEYRVKEKRSNVIADALKLFKL